MTRRAAGFAMTDFIAGTVILAGVLAAWTSATRAQLGAAGAADRRTRALYAAEEALVRFEAASGFTRASEARTGGGAFAEVERFDVAGLLPTTEGGKAGLVEVRPLEAKVEGAVAPQAFEARARVEWRSDGGRTDRLEVSTILCAPAAAAGAKREFR